MSTIKQEKTNSSWLKTFSIGLSIVSFGITIAIIGYIVLTTKQNQTANQQPTTISPTTPQSSLTPASDETANWKIYTDSRYMFSFKYPSNWYFENSPTSSSKFVIDFFKIGTPAQHGGGEASNDVIFNVSTNDPRSFDQIKQDSYNNLPVTTFHNMRALKRSPNSMIIELSNRKTISIGGSNFDQILSTFQFTQ